MIRALRHRLRGIRAASVEGFTLVEIIVVLVATGLMAVVASAALNGLGGGRAAAASRLIQRDLTFARQRAIATGSRCWVSFDAANDSYQLLVENPASPGRAAAVAIDDPGTGRAFIEQLNDGAFADVNLIAVSFDGGAHVGFDWLGQPLNSAESPLAGDGVIALSHGYQVVVDAGSGRVTITGP
jgi:Tfp pilus assembly protein FimT